MWIGYATIFSFQNHFFHSKWTPNYKNYSQFNISPTLGLENSKLLSLNLAFKGFLELPKKHAQIFLYFLKFYLNEFSMKICSILNNVFKTLWNELGAALLVKGFPIVLRMWQEASWFGDLNMTTFLHRLLNNIPS